MESVYRATGESRPSLALVAAVFARDSNLTFGGGTATAETLRREVVARRGWVLDSDFRLAYAASRLTPGTNLLAICAALGSRIRGLEGALIALLASSIPSAAIVAMMMASYQDVAQYPGVANAARGAVAVSAVLLLSSVWALIHPQLASGKRFRAVLLVALCWAAYDLFQFSALTVLLAAALVGSLSSEGSAS